MVAKDAFGECFIGNITLLPCGKLWVFIWLYRYFSISQTGRWHSLAYALHSRTTTLPRTAHLMQLLMSWRVTPTPSTCCACSMQWSWNSTMPCTENYPKSKGREPLLPALPSMVCAFPVSDHSHILSRVFMSSVYGIQNVLPEAMLYFNGWWKCLKNGVWLNRRSTRRKVDGARNEWWSSCRRELVRCKSIAETPNQVFARHCQGTK